MAFASGSSLAFGSRANSTITAPSGIADGDILVYTLGFQNVASSISATAPTGFSAFNGAAGGLVAKATAASDPTDELWLYAWWKRASGESGDYSATHATTTSVGYMFRYTGRVASGDPTDNPNSTGNSGGTGGGGSGGTLLATGVTTAVDDTDIIFLGLSWAGSGATDPPTGTTPTFTERDEQFGVGWYAATGPMVTFGPTGNKSASTSPAVNRWVAGLLALEPAAGGGGSAAPIAPAGDVSGIFPIWEQVGVM